MKRTGYTDLPLHTGKAPRWLFNRMVKLARYITEYIITEFSPEEFLNKIADPFWFQAFGAVLGFDWHSSGLTTTVCGALKEALKPVEKEFGIFIAGGKGGTSRKTPDEILQKGEYININPEILIYASKLSAKVDNTALQDGFQLYHHTFIFTTNGRWAVIQQGMNPEIRYARRYHWLSSHLKSFVEEPHFAICCDIKTKTLNLVAKESKQTQKVITTLSNEKPEKILNELNYIEKLSLPRRHFITPEDIDKNRLYKILLKTYETKPDNFEKLLGISGLGPKTLRALTLVSELIYGTKPSYKDPVRFSFAHGGKDGHPYPVDRETYDRTIEILRKSIEKIKIDRSEKNKALYRLFKFFQK